MAPIVSKKRGSDEFVEVCARAKDLCQFTPILVGCLYEVFSSVYSRFPDSHFPGWFFFPDVSRKDVSRIVFFPDETFPGKTIPGWSLTRKDVSRTVIFPDLTLSVFYV